MLAKIFGAHKLKFFAEDKKILKQVQDDVLTRVSVGEGNIIKKAAFTLAEILITLGIIGVVAAMTLPTLISNVQKKIYVVKLKVAYATIQEGFKRMMADEQTTELEGTELYSSMNDYDKSVALLSKYFKNTGFERVEINGNCDKQIKSGVAFNSLNPDDVVGCDNVGDGIKIVFPNGITMFLTGSDVYVDINGLSGPHIMGRDWFHFALLPNGQLVPYYGFAHMRYQYLDYYGHPNLDLDIVRRSIMSECSTSGPEDEFNGNSCASRIIDLDNWQMKY